MSVGLVRILTPLRPTSNLPSLVPDLAFDLSKDRCRVLGRRPGTDGGAVAVSQVR